VPPFSTPGRRMWGNVTARWERRGWAVEKRRGLISVGRGSVLAAVCCWGRCHYALRWWEDASEGLVLVIDGWRGDNGLELAGEITIVGLVAVAVWRIEGGRPRLTAALPVGLRSHVQVLVCGGAVCGDGGGSARYGSTASSGRMPLARHHHEMSPRICRVPFFLAVYCSHPRATVHAHLESATFFCHQSRATYLEWRCTHYRSQLLAVSHCAQTPARRVRARDDTYHP